VSQHKFVAFVYRPADEEPVVEQADAYLSGASISAYPQKRGAEAFPVVGGDLKEDAYGTWYCGYSLSFN
jgi:hypothetical protein